MFILAGGLIAAATNRVVSINESGMSFGEEFEKGNKSRENIILYENEPIKMHEYTVTYMGDTTEGVNTFYRVNYKVIDEKTRKIKEEFNLYPNAQQNAKMRSIVASPDTKHYLFRDIYTHVSMVALKEEEHTHEGHTEDENYEKAVAHEIQLGDTVKTRKGYIVLKGVNQNAKVKDIPLASGDVAVGLQLQIVADNKQYSAEPIFLIKGGNKYDFGQTLDGAGLMLSFSNIYPAKGKLELTVREKKPEEKKWIVMKAIEFPYINLLWGGTIIMVVGFLLSIFRRNKEIAQKGPSGKLAA